MEQYYAEREEWLNAAADMFRETYDLGALPISIRFSCGWPAKSQLAGKTKGKTFYPHESSDQTTEVFISPEIDGAMTVLVHLAHELCHAMVGKDGHRGEFSRLAKKIGLAPPYSTPVASPLMVIKSTSFIERLGIYPHQKIIIKRKPQTTRMILVKCYSCGFSFRTSQKNIDKIDNNSPCLSCSEYGWQEPF